MSQFLLLNPIFSYTIWFNSCWEFPRPWKLFIEFVAPTKFATKSTKLIGNKRDNGRKYKYEGSTNIGSSRKIELIIWFATNFASKVGIKSCETPSNIPVLIIQGQTSVVLMLCWVTSLRKESTNPNTPNLLNFYFLDASRYENSLKKNANTISTEIPCTIVRMLVHSDYSRNGWNEHEMPLLSLNHVR